MTKKVLLTFILFFVFAADLMAVNTRLALEISRAKQMDKVILRVNAISEYINLYVMEKGRIPPTIAILQLQYPNMILTNGYNGNITFTILNNIIIFSGVASNLSPIVEQIYRNSSSLHPFAVVVENAGDLTMRIPLDAQSIKFLGSVNMLESFDDGNTQTGNLLIDNNAPLLNQNCNVQNDVGKVWYQPNFMGDYTTYFCTDTPTWQWDILSNKLDIALYRPTVIELKKIKPAIGTKGYAFDGTVLHEYIYIGDSTADKWKKVE